MRIAVLGAGNVGAVLASGLHAAGHEVVAGVRDPAGPGGAVLPRATLAEAAAGAEVVVNALPGSSSLELLGGLGERVLAGKVLLDVANAVSDRYELLHTGGSLGQALQAALPTTRVVKTLNTVPAAVMAAPGSLPAPTSVFLSGDDPAAKAVVGGLLTDLGWAAQDQVDLGGIATARAVEHYLYLSLALMSVAGSTSYNVRVVA